MKTPHIQKRSRLMHTLLGCGYLKHCGYHPGTPFVIGITGICAFAGSEQGWVGGLTGALISLGIFGTIYLAGAHSRSVLNDKLEAEETEIGKEEKSVEETEKSVDEPS